MSVRWSSYGMILRRDVDDVGSADAWPINCLKLVY